jgi:hypothetical protein
MLTVNAANGAPETYERCIFLNPVCCMLDVLSFGNLIQQLCERGAITGV